MATGAALSAPLLSILLSGCKTEAVNQATSLEAFSTKDFEVLELLVDLIIPESDSPSASQVGVHNIIDHMIATVYSVEDKKSFFGNFQKLGIHLSTMDFYNQNSKDQTEILEQVLQYEDEGLGDVKKGLLDIRQQCIAYYLSTEEISKSFLNYLPVPQQWENCISVEEAGGKAWAI